MVEKAEQLDDEGFADYIVKIGFASFIWTIILVLIFLYYFKDQNISNDISDCGAIGDFFGGLINPFVGICTIILIVISVSIQRKELRSSVKELQKANERSKVISFEQSLFSWLATYHALISSIRVENEEEKVFEGRVALDKFIRGSGIHLAAHSVRKSAEVPDKFKKLISPFTKKFLLNIDLNDQDHVITLKIIFKKAIENYERMYKTNRSKLDAPLRTIYRIIKWIDSSDLSDKEKWHYCALVRSQLSDTELTLFFYNCLTSRGENFIEYINKYSFFDNLEGDELIEIIKNNSKEIFSSGEINEYWKYKVQAFSSSKGRNSMSLK